MIPAPYYQSIYLIILAIITFFVLVVYRANLSSQSFYRRASYGVSIILLACVILYIGCRPISEFFVDMTQYLGIYQRNGGDPFVFSFDKDNFIYDNLMYYCASAYLEPRIFYLIIATIYFSCIYIAVKKLFKTDTLLAFLVYLSAFSTFSYGVNGIKAGAAASIFLVSLAYNDRKFISLLLCVISYGFHHAMALPICAYYISIFVKRYNVIMAFWLLCLGLAAAHVTYFQFLFASLTDDHGASYLLDSHAVVSGFRIDFILYSVVPIVLGYYFFCKKLVDRNYLLLWSTYVICNSIWLLCTYASFTNRIAYLSWLLYPIVLIYPFFKNKMNTYSPWLIWTVILHLSFTLLMNFVYYA